jgi:hypothetical protein
VAVLAALVAAQSGDHDVQVRPHAQEALLLPQARGQSVRIQAVTQETLGLQPGVSLVGSVHRTAKESRKVGLLQELEVPGVVGHDHLVADFTEAEEAELALGQRQAPHRNPTLLRGHADSLPARNCLTVSNKT